MAESQRARPQVGADAARLRERYAWLNRFSDDELREISFCYEGDELDPDDEYFDVNSPESGVLRGLAGGRVPKNSCLVARGSVTPTIWSKLIAQPR